MSTDNKHIHYSAEDIQRYLQGKMNPQEMHALERAALDDEFLADAIEGYALLEDDHKSTLEGLKDSLTQKTSGKVVEMKKGGWKQWYRIAAALFILLGSAAIIYKYVFTNKAEELTSTVAKQEPKKENETTGNSKVDSNASGLVSTYSQSSPKEKEKKINTQLDSSMVALNNVPAEEKNTTDDKTKDELTAVPKKAEEPKTLAAEKAVHANANYKFTQEKKAKQANSFEGIVAAPVTSGTNARFNNLNKNNQALTENLNQNIFKGRVLNTNNEPLTYAKISILNDSFKIGTYTDAKGYFNFISADTVLQVEAKSIGFNNKKAILKSGLPANNQLVLTENNQQQADIVIKSDRTDRVKSLRDLMKDTTKLAEPEDGWGNYAAYMANNLELPDNIKINTQHGVVELSFTVDKNGAPQNINIEKSYSKQVDAEAIRLVKEGPKWKSKNRNKKGKVVVVF